MTPQERWKARVETEAEERRILGLRHAHLDARMWNAKLDAPHRVSVTPGIAPVAVSIGVTDHSHRDMGEAGRTVGTPGICEVRLGELCPHGFGLFSSEEAAELGLSPKRREVPELPEGVEPLPGPPEVVRVRREG